MNSIYRRKTFFIFLFTIIFIILLIISFSKKSSSFSEIPNEIEDTDVYSISNTDNEMFSEEDNKTDIISEDIKMIDDTVSQISTYTSDSGQTYDMVGTLKIPSLNIDYPILANTSEELLKVSLTKYWGGNPNEIGNLCILGHNYKNSKFFSKLPNIKNDAIILITDTTNRTLEYKVYETSIISPKDNSCTSQLTDGHTDITLITCYYENGNKHATKRFVVKARAY